jgi:hypothetical protein
MQYLQLADGLEKKGRGKARFKKFAKGALKVIKTAAPIAVNFIPGVAQTRAIARLAKTPAGQRALKFATSKVGARLLKARKTKGGKFAIDQIKRVDLNRLRGGLRPKALGLTPVNMPDAEDTDVMPMVGKADPSGEPVVIAPAPKTIFGLPQTTALALGAAAVAGVILLTRNKKR